MKQYSPESIRNIAVVSHAGVGKTTLLEAALFHAQAISKMGSVSNGSTASDYDPLEIERGSSLSLTPCILEWKDCKINWIDTPGAEDLYGDVECALSAAEAAILLIDGESGVESGTEKLWEILNRHKMPRAVVVNRLDAEQADFQKAIGTTVDMLGANPIAVNLPIGTGQAFNGVVDIPRGQAFLYDGADATAADIPDDLTGLAQEMRAALVESAAESDEELLEKYFEEDDLTAEDIWAGLKAGFADCSVAPAFAVSAEKAVGLQSILDFIVDVFPSPADKTVAVELDGEELELPADADGPLVARIYKTIFDPYSGRLSLFKVYSGSVGAEAIYNVSKNTSERFGKIAYRSGKNDIETDAVSAGDLGAVAKLNESATGNALARSDKRYALPPIEFLNPTYSRAVFPEKEGDDDRLSAALARLTEEDPTLRVRRDRETNQTLLEGYGDQHLSLALIRAKQKFKAGARLEIPKVAYRETITRAVPSVEYTHKKQSGGAGQYGRVIIAVEPMERDGGYEFVDEIFGGSIDQQFRPSVDKGVRQAMESGPLAGYKVVDIKVRLMDGKTHPVDSKDIAFQIAGRGAFQAAMKQANPVILEPIMAVNIFVPEELMGDIIGDLNGRRGRVMGMEQVGKRQLIKATVPLSEMMRYQTDLKSMTSARGTYTMELERYEQAPANEQEKVIAQAKDEDEE